MRLHDAVEDGMRGVQSLALDHRLVCPWVMAHLWEVQLPLCEMGQQLLYRVAVRVHEITRGRGFCHVEDVVFMAKL